MTRKWARVVAEKVGEGIKPEEESYFTAIKKLLKDRG
jgi:hypothetical protein